MKKTILIAAASSLLLPSCWAASQYKVLHKFHGGDGEFPTAGLVMDSSGNLYGTTGYGDHAYGNVFELSPKTGGGWAMKEIYVFTGSDGNEPLAGLTFDQAGNLYGTTKLGGEHYSGTVFELTPSGGKWTETVLYNFCSQSNCDDGGNPFGGVIFDKQGNLYGSASIGGNTSGGAGIIFKLSPAGRGKWKKTTLYNFCPQSYCTDGDRPTTTLTLDAAGNLYGTTLWGGDLNCGLTGGCGLVFELSPTTHGDWKEKVLYKFKGGSDGIYPNATLIFDAAGALYGTTELGANDYGMVFALLPQRDGTWKEKVLHSFSGGRDGGQPAAGVIPDDVGNLYGTTLIGGSQQGGCYQQYGCGVVYKLALNGNGKWKETVLHTFLDRPGGAPFSPLMFDNQGNLYGTTEGDATTTYGSVYEVTP